MSSPYFRGTLVLFFLFTLWQIAVQLGYASYFVDLLGIDSRAGDVASSSWIYSFNVGGVLNETGEEKESPSAYFWLNSGGQLVIKDGVGRTLSGDMPAYHRWRIAYAASNPLDTEEGYRPQNVFRLLTRNLWDNAETEIAFRVAKDNLSSSPNRNESNGVFLMLRYKDRDNLYYAGVRVDGTAVIKKKYNGTYYTMAQIPVWKGVYDRDASPTHLPHSQLFRMKAKISTEKNGQVLIRLSLLRPNETTWKKILEVRDHGKSYGNTPPILGEGSFGIRTDFMDVEFSDFRILRG